MIQELLIFLLAFGAMAYLVRLVYMQFSSKKTGCNTNCKGCSSIDMEAIENKIKNTNSN